MAWSRREKAVALAHENTEPLGDFRKHLEFLGYTTELHDDEWVSATNPVRPDFFAKQLPFGVRLLAKFHLWPPRQPAAHAVGDRRQRAEQRQPAGQACGEYRLRRGDAACDRAAAGRLRAHHRRRPARPVASRSFAGPTKRRRSGRRETRPRTEGNDNRNGAHGGDMANWVDQELAVFGRRRISTGSARWP